MLKIGIVGCGAIGSFISKKVADGTIKNAKISAVYDRNFDKAEKISKMTGAKIVVVWMSWLKRIWIWLLRQHQ